MATKRMTLAEREQAALAADDAAPEVAAATPTPTAIPTAVASHGSPATTRLGIYLPMETFAEAKSAYMADLDNLDAGIYSIAGWVSHAIQTYASLSPARRQRIAEGFSHDTAGSKARTFAIPDRTLTLVDEALAADRKHGRMTSASGFALEAIRNAVGAARARNGGRLPIAPERLPKQSRKRQRA